MTHDLKDRFESEQHLTGTWVSIGHPTVAEVSASVGFDFVLIDTEHTTISLETLENMVRAVEAAPGDTEVVVRVPWNDHVRLKRVLDIGVGGVMIPMIDSRREAESLVEAVRYPPEGIRGVASGRATGDGRNFEEYVGNAGDSLLTIVQIETESGLANVDEIASLDGVDSLFVGPADLSASLGAFGDFESDAFEDAVDAVVGAGDDQGLPVGTLTTDTDAVEDRLAQGFDYLVVGKDTATLAAADRAALRTYEQAAESATGTPTQSD